MQSDSGHGRPLRVLLLAGTAEAAALDRALAGDPRYLVTASLAGVTRQPGRFAALLHSGGFGGTTGFASYLREQQVDVVINATHPFAARMSQTVSDVTREQSLPSVRLLRPPWAQPGDAAWIPATDLTDAARLLPDDATGFLALGQRHLAAFVGHPARLVVRSLEPPPDDLLPDARWIIAPPGQSVREEARLLAETGATHLVARNSGGSAGWPKIGAAGRAGLPTIMVSRPATPAQQVLETIPEVLAWLERLWPVRDR
ncbi:MAG: precorrin-6A/cobalt-precorrin-6A reductase [Minwuia sp.]|nr:precorrin-6A/cobalt-precorrin-6A reductase [Minwuia sp.]